ncbi:MAG: ribonuclease P protein component [Verrucomicrobiota bacterium]
MKLPRSRRLLRRAEFQRVRSHGKSKAGRFFVLGYLPVSEVHDFRVGLITTKRIGNAVIRNRTRRRLRAVLHRCGEKIKPGYWIVLIARSRGAEASSEQLEKEFKWLLHQTDLMRDQGGPKNES